MTEHAINRVDSGSEITSAALSFCMSLAAGLLTWGFVNYLDPKGEGEGLFKVPEQYHIRALGESEERWSAYLAQQNRVDLQNAALVIGILGAAMGVAMIFGGPLVTLPKRLLVGVPLGFLVGVAAGVAGCLLQQSFEKGGQISVEQSAYVNALLFGVLGLGVGAIAGGITGTAKTVVDRAVVGMVLGIAAGFAYPMIAYCVMATANIEDLIPKATSARVLWLGVGTGILGLLTPLHNLKATTGKSKLDASLS